MKIHVFLSRNLPESTQIQGASPCEQTKLLLHLGCWWPPLGKKSECPTAAFIPKNPASSLPPFVWIISTNEQSDLSIRTALVVCSKRGPAGSKPVILKDVMSAGLFEIFTCSMWFQIQIWHIWQRMNTHDLPMNDQHNEIDYLTNQRVSTDWKDKQLPYQQLEYLLLLKDSQELWTHQTNPDQDNLRSFRNSRTSSPL